MKEGSRGTRMLKEDLVVIKLLDEIRTRKKMVAGEAVVVHTIKEADVDVETITADINTMMTPNKFEIETTEVETKEEDLQEQVIVVIEETIIIKEAKTTEMVVVEIIIPAEPTKTIMKK